MMLAIKRAAIGLSMIFAPMVAAQAATLTSTLTVSGATFSNGSVLSGDVVYQYDGSNVTSVTSMNMHVTAGTGFSAISFVYDVPNTSNTVNLPDFYNSNGFYQFNPVSISTGAGMWFLFTGLGASAQFVITPYPHPNTSSIYMPSSDFIFATDAGTSFGTPGTATDVPEPASALLLAAGAAAVGFLRRKRSDIA